MVWSFCNDVLVDIHGVACSGREIDFPLQWGRERYVSNA